MPVELYDCPHCKTRGVLPMPGGICPNCKKSLVSKASEPYDPAVTKPDSSETAPLALRTIKAGQKQAVQTRDSNDHDKDDGVPENPRPAKRLPAFVLAVLGYCCMFITGDPSDGAPIAVIPALLAWIGSILSFRGNPIRLITITIMLIVGIAIAANAVIVISIVCLVLAFLAIALSGSKRARTKRPWYRVILLTLLAHAIPFLIVGFVIYAYHVRSQYQLRRGILAYEQGIISYEQKQYEDAASHIGRYLAMYPSDVNALRTYARAKLKLTPSNAIHIHQAILAYQRILRTNPIDEEAAGTLLEIYVKIKEFKKAEHVVTDFLNNGGKPTSKMIFQQAITQDALKNYSDAYALLVDLVRSNPNYIDAYTALGIISRKIPDKVDKSPEDWHDEMIFNNPNNAKAYLVRAYGHFCDGDRKKAADDVKHVLVFENLDFETRLELANQLCLLEMYEECKHLLSKLELEDPSNLNLWRIKANLTEHTGNRNEMFLLAENIIRKVPEKDLKFLIIDAARLLIKCAQYKSASECISRMKTNYQLSDTVTSSLEEYLSQDYVEEMLFDLSRE